MDKSQVLQQLPYVSVSLSYLQNNVKVSMKIITKSFTRRNLEAPTKTQVGDKWQLHQQNKSTKN